MRGSFYGTMKKTKKSTFSMMSVCPAETSLVCKNINLASWWGSFTSTYKNRFIGGFPLKILKTIKN